MHEGAKEKDSAARFVVSARNIMKRRDGQREQSADAHLREYE